LARPFNAEATNRSEKDQFGARLFLKLADSDRQIIDEVGSIAARRAIPRAQVALAWMLGKPEITAPIIGATKPEHLRDAVAALDVKLTDEEVKALEAPYVPHPVSGISW
jgi:aryl-alcohol dehydrogenase-like predicted oxidoreductase